MNTIPGSVTSPQGFKAAGIAAGIKASGNKDLALIFSETPCSAAGVFTLNRVKAAPVFLCQSHLADGRAQAVVVNSGNANCCTGDQGMADARRMAAVTAEALGLKAEDVLPGSTGVIGVPLPMAVVEKGIRQIAPMLSPTGGDEAAEAIMTTDTVPKKVAIQVQIGGKTVTLGGMAKGAGMIAPNMGTMLSFLTTDVKMEPELLKSLLKGAVDRSYNMVTVDGDTSTNDTVILMANGASGVEVKVAADVELFRKALSELTLDLAKQIARDGEGATKFVTVRVTSARVFADAKTVALSVANSNLVKTAIFGRDPNWGRILCAAGYSGAELDPNRVRVSMVDIPIFANGTPVPFDKPKAIEALSARDVLIEIDLGDGSEGVEAYTCDFSYDYVKINAEYTT
ncbi:MAG: bifunctional glutamate N-acetyltransferase/amino-acid acetyltransferase ArgJ [Candidatus Latescibacteria bacterium]|nr:bifunctional glutamate N-acetyltransferase/amino-acid acetyltransferase ArgJ [Candidatus Latescibacterota bacterium]